MTVAALGVAGRPNFTGGRIKRTIPWSTRLTAATQVTRQTISGLSNGGTSVTDSTTPATGGQASWIRFGSFGGAGSHWYLNDVTAGSPVNLTGRYWRYRARLTVGSGTIRFLYWRFADSKAAHDAGNYVQFLVAPTVTGTTGSANFLPEATWVWDGFDPVNNGVAVGSGVTSWASVGYVAAQLWQNTTGPVLDIAEVQAVTKAGSKAKCVFWHDDTVQYGAAALASRLAAYSFPWEEATEWESIGAPGQSTYFTPAQAAAYAATGVHFGSHATTNPEHNQNTPAQLQNQTARNRMAAWRLGLANSHPEDMQWWGGQSYTQDYLDVIRQYYRSGRGNTTGITRPEMIPPAESHLYKAILADTGATRFADTYQPLVDAAIATTGVCSFVIHQDTGNTGTNSDNFRSQLDLLLAYLDSNRASIDVCTWTDVMALCT